MTDAGGLCLKFVSPGWAGAPDRIIVLPELPVAFCEVKRPGEKPRKLQYHRLEELRERGATAGWVNTRERVDEMLKCLQSGSHFW